MRPVLDIDNKHLFIVFKGSGRRAMSSGFWVIAEGEKAQQKIKNAYPDHNIEERQACLKNDLYEQDGNFYIGAEKVKKI